MERGDTIMLSCGNRRLPLVLSLLPSLLALGCDHSTAEKQAIGEQWAAIVDFVAKEDLPSATKQLITLGEAQDGSIYAEGIPSPFSKLKEVFIARGRSAYFRKMLQSDEVAVRAMAMSCLVETEHTKAIPDLRSRLWSRVPLRYQSGCIGSTITEGAYARGLLLSSYLPREQSSSQASESADCEDLLSKEDQWTLDLEILSRNDAAAMHKDAARSIREAFGGPEARGGLFSKPESERRKPLPVDWTALRRLGGTLTDAAIVKALGRLEQSEAIERFLIDCVGEARLEAQARLAAASALTRYPDSNAEKAIESHREEFDRLEKNAGTVTWETFRIRKKYEKAMAPIRAQRTWQGMDKIKDKVLGVLKEYRHPMALREVLQMGGLALLLDHKDVARARAESILKISEELAIAEQSWNTYGREVYYLEFYVGEDDKSEEWYRHPAGTEYMIKNLLGRRKYRRLIRNMSAAVREDRKQRLGKEGG